MTFERLREFISTEMRVSQAYQPVMLIELLTIRPAKADSSNNISEQ